MSSGPDFSAVEVVPDFSPNTARGTATTSTNTAIARKPASQPPALIAICTRVGPNMLARPVPMSVSPSARPRILSNEAATARVQVRGVVPLPSTATDSQAA